MTYKKPWLTSIIVMSIFALFGVLGIMVLAQSQDAENSDEGRGESHEGGSEERDVRGNTDGEEAGRAYALDESHDVVRGGARLILKYDATNNTFSGTVENTLDEVLQSVRVEVHLSNGVELGPTTPIDLAPGEQADVMMDATNMVFDSWSTHVEVGLGEHSSRSEVCPVNEGSGEGSGEHAAESDDTESDSRDAEHDSQGTEHESDDAERDSRDMEHDSRDSDRAGKNETVAGRCEESGESSVSELNEAAMSSPITALDQRWNGILRGLAISMQYEETTRSIYGTVENISTQKLCYVQAEPHLKLERQTVAELGPEKLGDLDPGQRVYSSLSVDDEPDLTEIVFNGYVIHMEVFDCDGPGPIAHTGGEGAEGGSESGESGGEHGHREGRGEHEGRQENED